MVSVLPWSVPLLAAVRLPPWALMMARLIVRPMPEPVRSCVRAESAR